MAKGKRGGKREAPSPGTAPGLHRGLTMREEARGKQRQTNNVKSMLKLNHLQNLAIWASQESSISSLAAFYGHQFAVCGEVLGVPPDPSLFPCQRCETILQPGFNCKVRIEKNQAKKRQRVNRNVLPTENNVVYTCGFCSHRNVKRGTSKGHMRDIIPTKAKVPSKRESTKATPQAESALMNATVTYFQANEAGGEASQEMDKGTEMSYLETPPAKLQATLLLDSKRKKRKTLGSKTPDSECIVATVNPDKTSDTSRKRRRRSWTTLKEIAQSSELERSKKISCVSIPFVL